jgi:hypothetical protein
LPPDTRDARPRSNDISQNADFLYFGAALQYTCLLVHTKKVSFAERKTNIVDNNFRHSSVSSKPQGFGRIDYETRRREAPHELDENNGLFPQAPCDPGRSSHA